MGRGRKWVFKHPGSYLVRLGAEGYHSAWIRVVVKPDAEEKVVEVDTELEEIE